MVVLFEHEGDAVHVTTSDKPLRFLLVSVGRSTSWRHGQGPIVMNSQEKLKVAFDEYNRGTFIKA